MHAARIIEFLEVLFSVMKNVQKGLSQTWLLLNTFTSQMLFFSLPLSANFYPSTKQIIKLYKKPSFPYEVAGCLLLSRYPIMEGSILLFERKHFQRKGLSLKDLRSVGGKVPF